MVDTKIAKSKVAFYKGHLGKWFRINFSDVMYIDTNSELCSRIVFKDGRYVDSNESLIKISSFLPFEFERIHRTCIVNIKYVDYVDHRNKVVVLNGNVQLKFGLSYIDNIQKYFVNA